MENLMVLCADVGSVKRDHFAWYDSAGPSGTSLLSLAERTAELVNEGAAVALGFECPLFIPVADDEMKVTAARSFEGQRPWSAAAGCAALATGVAELTWVLAAARRRVPGPAEAFLSLRRFLQARSGLFVWEAFVSAGGKRSNHLADAMAAVEAFEKALPGLRSGNAVLRTSQVVSLAAAALLRTGWSSDVGLLGEPCLVVKA
jgi:hypothetical protein